MRVCGSPLKKLHALASSTYDTRTKYLQAMKRLINSQHPDNDDIEEYFQYEKEVSSHIQELLDHSTVKDTG